MNRVRALTMNRLGSVIAIAFLFLVGASSVAYARQFRKATYYSTGKNSLPYAIVCAQLTSTGNTDLVIADYLSDQVVTLLGNGDGTFRKPLIFPIGAPFALAVGDFNEDGKPDLAVVESAGNQLGFLQILLGEGDGTFRKGKLYQLGIEPTSVAAADFNGDGHVDLAVANNGVDTGKGSMMVFVGTGKGTFNKPMIYKLGALPWGIAAGDLNGDHQPDLVVTQFGAGATVFLNDGTGHFGKPVSYSAGGGEVVDVKIADLRNSGEQDLVIANRSQGMVVLLNDGDGTFGKPTIYTPTFFNWQPPDACTVADFNLDGKLDVACAPEGLDAYVFYGKGNGKFGSGVEIKSALDHQGGFSIATGDFNNDKAPDLAIPIQNYGKVAILLNTQ